RLLDLLDRAVAELRARDGAGTEPADATWVAWERASERSGWVAASEAALVGVPEGLASAVGLRALEVAREPRGPEEGSSVTAVRAAGLSAVADAAWRAAARAAAQAVDVMAVDPEAPAGVLPV